MTPKKQEALQQLQQLQAEVDRLREVINRPDEWEPKGGYHTIRSTGEVHTFCAGSSRGSKSEMAQRFGMSFSSSTEAERARDVYRSHHRLYKLAQELNGDWRPDFTPQRGAENYYVIFNHNSMKWDTRYNAYCRMPGAVYFSYDAAKAAARMLNDGEVKL